MVMVALLVRFHALPNSTSSLFPALRPLEAEIVGSGAHRITGTKSLRRAKQNTNPICADWILVATV